MAVHDMNFSASQEQKRPQFGSRYLSDPDSVFRHNAWDNVKWDESLEESAREKVKENSALIMDVPLQEKYEEEASHFWDEFYEIHQNKFFKDRHWLFTEFPELAPNLPNKIKRIWPTQETGSGPSLSTVNNSPLHEIDAPSSENLKLRIFEIGCGVGNTIFPILQADNPNIFVYGCDFSGKAVTIIQENSLYRPDQCEAFVCDICRDQWDAPFPEGSMDIIIMIFVLSAIHPDKMQHVVNKASEYLKPGGRILFRDYGRYDMAQLRFKKGRCLGENFYVRGDGTRVYFFTQDELRKIFTTAGLVEEQNIIDRRLQVNRGKLLTMYRVWIQCKYRKPM